MKLGSLNDSKVSYIDSYNLSVYGDYDLEPVLIELVNSPIIQRLKNIQQHGPDSWVWKHANITRFEHSVGVMLLLKKFCAPLREQVAGLLHDASHGAFSHAIDFVYGNQMVGDFAEKMATEVIGNSDIPEILIKHGFTMQDVFNTELYPLLERATPDLCADRLDYFFRDSYRYRLISMEDIHQMMNSLTVYNRELVFSNFKSALMFGRKYLEAADKIFGSKESIFFYTMIADAIKIALENRILTREDLFILNDEEVRSKLIKSANKDVKQKLSLISNKTKFELVDENPELHLMVKTRVVDPKVVTEGKIERLSELDPSYSRMLYESKVRQGNGYKVKVYCVD